MNSHVGQMRVFAALPVPAAPRIVAILDWLDAMDRSVRVVKAAQLHLTLKFLGEVAADRVDIVREVLDQTARSSPPFAWSIQGLGAFPTVERPRVVWADCIPPEPLVVLARAIDEGMARHGFERERNVFRPHLTLARVRGGAPRELRQFLESRETPVLTEQWAESIVLFQSILSKRGATHEPIHISALTGS